MDIYPHMLKSACETWFKTNYAGVYQSTFRIVKKPSASTRPSTINEELPELEIKVSVGPWQSIYVWFKSPGVVLLREERDAMNQLRSQGCRVAIVRHVEDFKTLIHTLMYPSPSHRVL